MLAVVAAVALASVLLYLPTANYRFVWDDNLLITGNPTLASAGPIDLFARPFWYGSPDPADGAAATYYRPVVTLSFWLDQRLWGADPRGFHVTNILLNALASAVIALVIWELLHSGVWALLGGLIFAAHSSHVESVAFISGRTDVLLALFTGLAALALLRSLRKHGRWWWLAVIPAFALGLLSKETAVLFPVLVATAPLLMRTRYDRRHLLLVAMTLLTVAGYWLLRAAVVPAPLPAAATGTLGQRLSDAANTFGFYIRTFFFPFDHHAKYPADPAFLTLTPNTIAALLFVVTIPLVALRRRFWVVLWGYAWTILFLLPVANIVPIGPQAAERLLYLPSAGLAMIVVTLCSRLLTVRPLLRQFAAVGLLVFMTLLGADTLMRSRVWRDEPTLFGAMIREAPRAQSAYANLADAIAGSHPDSAIGLYNRAIALDQGFVRAYINSAVLLSRKGDHRRAIHNLRLAGDLRPNSVQVANNLGLAFLAASQPESALAALDRGVAIEPNSATLHANRAAALAALGRPAEAEADLRRALALDPTFLPARLAMAARHVELGQADSALDLLSGAASRSPDAAPHLNRIGTLFITAGDSARAQECYRAAIAADSTNVPALYNQAALYAARGDPVAARPLAGRAHRLRPDLAPVTELYEQLTGSRRPAPISR